MADQKKIRDAISEILDGADLNTVTAKKVRSELEEKLGMDLAERKKEIDSIVMEILDEKQGGKEEEEESESEEEEKRPTKKRKPAKKASDDESGSEKGSDDEYKPTAKKSRSKKRKGSGSDEEDWGKKGAKRTPAKKAAGGAKKGGGGGYTKICKLSTELAAVMGEDSMARHEVVKRMWKIIKEKNLYDPKNKQFAICNPELLRVFGVKRFRTFGMMKYLKNHFE